MRKRLAAAWRFLDAHKKVLGLVLCLAVAGFFSTYHLSESPGTWFDEGIFTQIARNLHFGEPYELRVSATEMVPAGIYTTVGFPVIYPVAASFRAFGVGLLQARAVMVVFILLMVAALYLFASTVWDARIATWSTLIVATHAPVYGNGKNVLGEVPGLFFFFVLLYVIARLEKDARSVPLWLAGGIAAGLFMATKPNFLLLLPVLLIALVICRKRVLHGWRGPVAAATAIIVLLALYVATTFGFSAPLSSIFANYGSLPGLQTVTGLTLPALVLQNAFRFFHESTPMYLLATFAVWSAYIVVRWRNKIAIPFHEYVAIGFSAATILYFLKMPGFYRYLFVAQVITFPYFVAACFKLASSVQSIFTRRKLTRAVTFLLAVLVVFQLYLLLFNSWAADAYGSTRTAELTSYFSQLSPSTHVFFFHAPEAVQFYHHDDYSQYFEVVYFNDAVGKDQLPSLEQGIPDVVFVGGSVEKDALPHLGMYQRTQEVDHGRYAVYTRKSP